MSRLLAIIGILLVITAALLTWLNPFGEKLNSREFVGVVKEASGSNVLLNGYYIVDGKPSGKLADVRVSFAEGMTITRTVHYRPSQEELKKTNGIWNPNTAPSVQETKTVADLKNLIGRDIVAHAALNVFGKKSFIATSITYDDNDWAPANKPAVVK